MCQSIKPTKSEERAVEQFGVGRLSFCGKDPAPEIRTVIKLELPQSFAAGVDPGRGQHCSTQCPTKEFSLGTLPILHSNSHWSRFALFVMYLTLFSALTTTNSCCSNTGSYSSGHDDLDLSNHLNGLACPKCQ